MQSSTRDSIMLWHLSTLHRHPCILCLSIIQSELMMDWLEHHGLDLPSVRISFLLRSTLSWSRSMSLDAVADAIWCSRLSFFAHSASYFSLALFTWDSCKFLLRCALSTLVWYYQGVTMIHHEFDITTTYQFTLIFLLKNKVIQGQLQFHTYLASQFLMCLCWSFHLLLCRC